MSATHILGIATDLFFMPNLNTAAAAAGLAAKSQGQPGEAHDFVQAIQADPPALIVLDLSAELPWEEWLRAAKASATIRHIPWLAFGPHKEPELLQAARRAGADKVVARAAFSAELGKALQGLARG